MLSKIYEIYALLFAKPIFAKWNKFLYHLSLRGLGVLNYRTEKLRGEFDWLSGYIKDIKSPFIVDVGANVGGYTRDLLNINSNSKIVAIEPHPLTFSKFKNNIISNNVTSYNCAASDKNGVLELFDYAQNDGSSHASLYKEVISDLHKDQVTSHKIEVRTLDDILENNSKVIDLLKIDTEGNEFSVLVGAKKLLDNNFIKAIHLEFNEMNIISKTSFKDFWDLLSNKFKFYRLLPSGKLLLIKTYSTINCEIYHYQNIICLQKAED